MKKLLAVVALVMLGALSTGCSSIRSHGGENGNHWIIKNTGLGAMGVGLILSSTVYYCPPDGSPCVEAKGL